MSVPAATISTTIAAPREVGETFLIIFDFDDTITTGETDDIVATELGFRDAFLKNLDLYNSPNHRYTDGLSKIIGKYKKEELVAAVEKGLTINPDTIEMLRYLYALAEEGENPRVQVAIASDANICYIDEAFKRIIKLPSPPIYSNPLIDLRDTPEGPQTDADGNTIYTRLQWHFPQSHNCERCQDCPNMCKSEIVQRAVNNSKLRDPTVIFCGDGFNDSCPMQKVLRLRDHMFARRGFRLEKILVDDSEEKGVCHHHTWYTGEELHNLFKHVVGGGSKLLPPVVLMGNEGGHPSEFRTNYLQNMMQGIIGRVITEFEEKQQKRAESDGGADYSNLLSTLRQLCVDVSCVSDTAGFADENNLVHRKEFLPIPQSLLAYGNSWADLPWVHGCNYLQTLVWAITYRLGSPNPIALDDEFEKIAVNGSSTMSVEALRGFSIPKTFTNPIPTAQMADELANTFDMFLSEKTSVTETFFESHIGPMVAQVETFLKNFNGDDALFTRADDARAEILRLLSGCVWGNTVDLSMFNRSELKELSKQAGSPHAGHAADHKILDEKIVANDLEVAADYILARLQHYAKVKNVNNADACNKMINNGPAAIDIIMDNMGVECAADMLLGSAIVSLCPRMKVRYHAKPIPFCVSDVMPKDIEMMLRYWEKGGESSKGGAARFRQALTDGRIEVHTHPFWVHPSEYRDMPSSLVSRYFFTKRFYFKGRFGPNPPAYKAVKKHETKNFGLVDEVIVAMTDLAIFKGDVNFRRVCGDRHWTPEMFFHKSRPEGHVFADAAVPFVDVIADYWPYKTIPMLSLRTNKSEVCVGPTLEKMQALDAATGKAWRWNGKYAVANFAQ